MKRTGKEKGKIGWNLTTRNKRKEKQNRKTRKEL